MGLDIKNKSNSELLLLQKERRDEFEKVKLDIVRLYDYWMSIETTYNEISDEIGSRNVKK